jgi:hypothetical protein
VSRLAPATRIVSDGMKLAGWPNELVYRRRVAIAGGLLRGGYDRPENGRSGKAAGLLFYCMTATSALPRRRPFRRQLFGGRSPKRAFSSLTLDITLNTTPRVIAVGSPVAMPKRHHAAEEEILQFFPRRGAT